MGVSMSDVIRPARRTVVRSAAWSVPVVAVGVSAPAFAASPCATTYPWRLDWGGSSTSWSVVSASGVQTGSAVIAGPAGTAPLTVTFRSVMTGTMRRDADNFALSHALTQTSPVSNVGGLGQGPGLNISHQAPIPSGSANAQEVSISFDRRVVDLSFVITDIDAQFGGWIDRIELTGTRTGTGANIQGDGTSGAPWMPTTYGNADNDSGTRNLAVSYTSAIAANTPIVLKFWNWAGTTNQRIFLSDLTFDALGC